MHFYFQSYERFRVKASLESLNRERFRLICGFYGIHLPTTYVNGRAVLVAFNDFYRSHWWRHSIRVSTDHLKKYLLKGEFLVSYFVDTTKVGGKSGRGRKSYLVIEFYNIISKLAPVLYVRGLRLMRLVTN